MLLYLFFTNTEKARTKVLRNNHEFIEWLTSNFLSFRYHSTYKQGESYFIEVDDDMFQWSWDYLSEQKTLHQFIWFRVENCTCECHRNKDIIHFMPCCDFQGICLVSEDELATKKFKTQEVICRMIGSTETK